MTPTAIRPEQVTTRRVLVLGGGDIGSAVAHRLFALGVQVVLSERPRSAHARRGMAFTDALFEGSAILEGVKARCVADAGEMLACWREGSCIPMITLPESLLLAEVRFEACVEATMRRYDEPPDIRHMAALAIGLGPGYRPGMNCHVAVETQWGSRMGQVLREQPSAPRRGGPRALAGITRERFAVAPEPGIWRTQARLGQKVEAGAVVGRLGAHEILAPIGGQLRGLTHDDVEVRAGARLVEVDPRQSPQIFGLGERPVAVATGVVCALGFQDNAVGQQP
jgi:xanthine dehydrogenase accessory factor